jgi:hypothetical protein
MDFYKQFQEHNRVSVLELKAEIETRLRPYWYATNTLMGALFRGRLPANWREQWRATCAEQADQGIITDPKSIQEIEDYLEAWAKFCGVEPRDNHSPTKVVPTRPTVAPTQKKTSGHRPGRKIVKESEALFYRHLARAQRYVDEIEAAITSLGAKIDAAQIGEEVDATPDVDRVEELIWSYNDAIESVRETWLRENLSGALNERLLALNTPLKYGMPLYTDEAQERRAMLQGLEISRRLMGRNAVMDRIVATMQTIEIAGDVAGIALGAGAVITIVKKGGKWALVKTVIRGVIVDAAARAAERALEEAGVDQATLGGAKLAATLINLILRRRIRAVSNRETPPPQRPPNTPPPPPNREPTTPPVQSAEISGKGPKVDNLESQRYAPSARKARLPPRGSPERKAIESARRQGIDAAKERELSNIRAGGNGSGVWTATELEEIRKTGRFPADVRWHHNPTVANRPDLAGDPSVIQPIRGGIKGHLEAHGGDFRKPYPEEGE